MLLELSLNDTASVVTVSGGVDAVDVAHLRDRLLKVLDENARDVVLDMRRGAAVGDHLMAALTAVRSRAKFLRHRIVVVDDADGATRASLRRLGMIFRIPVYDDPAAATAGLRADRAARARLTVGWRSDRPNPETGHESTELGRATAEGPGPEQQSGRVLSRVPASPPIGTGTRP